QWSRPGTRYARTRRLTTGVRAPSEAWRFLLGRSPHRQRVPAMQGRSPPANLPEESSILPVSGIAEASLTEEPGAEKQHAGLCAGTSGNLRPYRDDQEKGEYGRTV